MKHDASSIDPQSMNTFGTSNLGTQRGELPAAHSTGAPSPSAPFNAAAVDIVTVAYRSRTPLAELLQYLPPELSVIVVDNSRDAEIITDIVHARPNTRYVDSGGNVGFGVACNTAARLSDKRYLLFVNPDARPSRSCLAELVSQLDRDPGCCACAPALSDESGATQIGAGGWQPTLARAITWASGMDRLFHLRGIWFRSAPATSVEVEWLAGTCLAIRRDVFLGIGGFDPRYFLYQEDMDLGRRLKARGYRQMIRADLVLEHAKGGSSPGESNASLWSLRANALAAYVRANYSEPRATALRLLLGTGYGTRWLYYALRYSPTRASEMGCYARTLLIRGAANGGANPR